MPKVHRDSDGEELSRVRLFTGDLVDAMRRASCYLLSRFCKTSSTYQSISRLVLVNRTDPRPVKVYQKCHAGSVERVLGRHHPKEVREAIAREHRMRVRVAELQPKGTSCLVSVKALARLKDARAAGILSTLFVRIRVAP